MEQSKWAPGPEKPADLGEFPFDGALTPEQRQAQVGAVLANPTCFRVGEMTVTLEFLPEGPTLQQVFVDLMHRKTHE